MELDRVTGQASGPGRGSADVLIVGGGFAGSLLALCLANRGINVQLADLHRLYPPDFRCEKFGPDQAALLAELGALAPIAARAGARSATPADLIRQGLGYEDMVNGVRDAWPRSVGFHEGRAISALAGEDLQTVELAGGERLTGRLLVLATGRNERLRRALGIERRMLHDRHSFCIGFSLEPRGPLPFAFESLVRHGERAGDGIAFVSLFPMHGAMRVNLFCYRDPAGAWAKGFRTDPLGGLLATFPRLRPLLGDARVIGAPDFGVIDLYDCEAPVRPGVVLIGDAYRSSCPATAMGMTRVLTDVRQLAGFHAPAWLATPGMSAVKIAGFYDDPVKRAVDLLSQRRAETGRAAATALSPRWRAYRAAARARRLLHGALAGLNPPHARLEAAA